jgi:hydroxyacylglutathione hydrolase
VAIVTGDALMICDVGCTGFFPDQAKEVADLLYGSIFNKLLFLGDQTIIYPSHGAKSVCGEIMACRKFSNIGLERLNNPVLLKTDHNACIEYKVNEHHYLPPYFKNMEEYNQQGAPN